MITTKTIKNVFAIKWVYHLTFWCIITLIVFLIVRPLFPDTTPILSFLFSINLVAMITVPVYIHFYLLGILFVRKRYTVYSLSVIIIIVAFSYFYYIYFFQVYEVKNNYFQWFADISFVLIITTAIKLIKDGFTQKIMMQEIASRQLRMELDLLKSQINPHFLFNTLNSLFSMALEKNDTALAKSLSNLSNLMRYSIYDIKENTVPLAKEVDQIQRFIELQKLRFDEKDDIHIAFNTSGNLNNINIQPMLLFPFIENAFKHGISVFQYSNIEINLSAEINGLDFSVTNTIHRSENPGSSRIGLVNVKRRLELLYPAEHTLRIEDDGSRYSIQLRIIFGIGS